MMDEGGGSGVYAIEVARKFPNMSAVIVEIESVAKVADQYIKRANQESRVKTVALDFFNEDLPRGCDVAFLSNIVHVFSQDRATVLLKKIHDCLDGGVIIISEWVLNDKKTGPVPSALMGLNMIVETYEGRNYSFAELSDRGI